MINWGALQGGGFQNALAQGFQMGQVARQQQDARDERNALAAFASNPSEATVSELARFRPELVMQYREAEAKKQAGAVERRRADLPLLTNLVESATDEASYQRNLQTAREYGIDISTLPPSFDPNWRDTQLASLRALQTPQGREVLSTIGKVVADSGFRPGTPEFAAEVQRLWGIEQQKLFTYQPGGGAGIFNPVTNQTQQIVQPGGGVSGEAVDLSPDWEVVEEGTGSNVGGGF